MKKLIILCVLLFTFGSTYFVEGQTVSTLSLLNEMVDLELLSEMPEPYFSTIQYSSYDRRSEYPHRPGWFMNADGFGGEPIPGFLKVLKKPDSEGVGEYLICDEQGPGAIVRLWTARIEGEITLWLDGKEEPIYKGPAQKFFQHTYEAFLDEDVKDLWNGTLAQNTAGYYPIPYEKGCRMEWKGKLNTLHFYHVQVRQYQSGTKVKTFSKKDISKNLSRINEIAEIMEKPSLKLDDELSDAQYHSVWLKPGESKTLMKSQGAGAIKRLAVFVIAKDIDLALRQTVMDIRFDGSPWGQVQSPVGDFFGAAPGINPYESLPFSVLDDGRMVCRYFMPFRDSVEILLNNMGDQEVTITSKIVEAPYKWKEGESLHFRARWRIDHGLLADPAVVKDIPYLMIKGKGRMVGAAAFIMNPTFVPSSYGNWWGEGDEKIFIDDNLSPAFIGTGSEDYFNYAWSSADLFAHAYCGQPRNDGPANRGFVTNYRWHILDNIAFEKGFDFYMELYSHRVVKNFSYGRMIYVYAVPECHDDHLIVTKADVRALEMPADWWPEADGWAVNASFYQVEDLLSKPYEIEEVKDYRWSDGEMLKWTPKSKDDELVLWVPITDDGKYMLAFTVACAPGYGKVSFELNGELLKLNGADEHDLSTAYQPIAHNLKSGNIDLKAGMQVIRIKPVGDKLSPVGLDFIWVKKQ